MKWLLWPSHNKKRKQEIDALGKEAALVHRRNIEKIVKSRKPAATLIKVLDKNHITIEIAKAMGH